ncbi:MAG TPA: hypothetical protein DD979_00445 [Gammaproteobacteria bacterium]|nr:hypothetical protein [Gammaproteobacteria bacterium]
MMGYRAVSMSACRRAVFSIRYVLWLGLAMLPLGAQAQSETQRVADMLASEGDANEAALAQLIQNALTADDAPAAFSAYSGSQVVGLNPREIALRVLERNLAIEDARSNRDLARQAQLEARAVFDPVLNLNVGIKRTDSFDRTVTGTVSARVFYPQYEDPVSNELLEPGVIVLPELVQDDTGIEKIVFNNLQEDREIRDDQTIFASKEDPNGAQTETTFDVVLEQATPWGVTYDFSFGTVHKEVFYDNRGNSFDAPWASTVLFNVEVPVNDFGEDASVAVESRVAALEEQRQDWLLKTRINGSLQTAALAYLELINRTEQLRIALQMRELTQTQYEATRKRFRGRSVTTYDVSQIEAELAQARANVESAAEAYLVASDTLLRLSNGHPDFLTGRVAVPTGYSAWLQSTLAVNLDQAQQTALSQRPELQVGMLAVAQAEIRQKNATLRLRPDIRLKAGLELAQNGTVYGYDSVFDSVANVFDPDSSSITLSGEYRYPLGNKAIKANKAIADAQRDAAGLSEQQARRQVEQEVANAVNALETAMAVKSHAEQQLDSADKAYSSVLRLSRAGSATQNQIINALRSLQQARITDLDASLAIKRAEAQLLAAQGSIDRQYATWVARNAFETWRLAALAQRGDFRFFVQ